MHLNIHALACRLLYLSYIKLGLEPPSVIAGRGQQLTDLDASAMNVAMWDGLERRGERIRLDGGVVQEEGAMGGQLRERRGHSKAIGSPTASKSGAATPRTRQEGKALKNTSPALSVDHRDGGTVVKLPRSSSGSKVALKSAPSSMTSESRDDSPARPKRKGRTVFADLVPGPEALRVIATDTAGLTRESHAMTATPEATAPSASVMAEDGADVFQSRVPRPGMAGPGGRRRTARKAALTSAAVGTRDNITNDEEGKYAVGSDSE